MFGDTSGAGTTGVDESYAAAFADGVGAEIMGGGSAAVRAGLVDDLHVGIAPIVLGRGNRVWEHLRGLELTLRVMREVAESGTIHVTCAR